MYIRPEDEREFLSSESILIEENFHNEGIYRQTNVSPEGKFQPFSSTSHIRARSHIKNIGAFIFEYSEAEIAPRIIFGSTRSFSNLGIMKFHVGGKYRDAIEPQLSKNVFEPDVLFAGIGSFQNQGRMELVGKSTHVLLFAVHLENSKKSQNFIVNDGLFFLQNAFWDITQKISGQGCIVLGESTEIVIRDGMHVSRKHFFHFKSSTQRSKLFIAVSDSKGIFFIRVSGFALSSYITFSREMECFGFNERHHLMFGIPGKFATHCIRLGSHYKGRDLFFNGKTLELLRPVQRARPEACKINLKGQLWASKPGIFPMI